MSPRNLRSILALVFISAALTTNAEADICVYQARDGEMKQARSLQQVPNRYRGQARCVSSLGEAGAPALAKPEDIKLEGNLRREDLSTSVGRIQLRWPRSVEALFGRTPLRAMADAAQTVSRALRSAAFPSELQNLNLDWQVVFMDANLPQTQIPPQLISNCHPGWMTPPANIYIVGQRVAGGCGGAQTATASVADSQLSEVLVHEMGHAVEFYLLRRSPQFDRMRAEGFATWFEMHAAEHSSIISASELRRRTHALAKYALRQNPAAFAFQGTGEDYARASMYFSAVVDRRGIRGLMEVYERMGREQANFISALKAQMYWDDKQLAEEVKRITEKY